MYGHRLPIGREVQLRDDRDFGFCEAGRLSRVGGARKPDGLNSRLVDGRRKSRRAGNHDQGNARVPGRGVRAYGKQELGIRRRSGDGGEPDGRDTMRGYRQTVDHQKPWDRH